MRIVPGQRVAIVGAGTVGCLVARLAAQIPVCDVELVDTNRARAAVARALGVGFAEPGAAAGRSGRRRSRSGTGAGLAAMALAGPESTVVDLGWYGDQSVAAAWRRVPLSPPDDQVVAGRSGGGRSARAGPPARRLEKALALLADPALDVLLTGETAFENLPSAMPALTTAAGDTICHSVTYG